MKRRIVIIAATFVAALQLAWLAPERQKTKIFIAGDSTAQGYNVKKTLMRGWGQLLADYIDTSRYEVRNFAKAGRSTKSFIDEARWDSIMNNVGKGDIVLIQFGHNDTSDKPERYTTLQQYRENLAMMVRQTRAKGAKPVLLTSIVMHTYKDSASNTLIDDRLKERPVITKRLARDMDVHCIDAYNCLRDTVIMLGNEKSKSLYMYIPAGADPTYPNGRDDDTHLCEAGARIVAKFIAEELFELKTVYKN